LVTTDYFQNTIINISATIEAEYKIVAEIK